MTRNTTAWVLFLATRVVGLVIDAGTVGAAYLAALILRFDFREPPWGWRAAALSYVTVCAAYLAALVLTGCYAFAWRRIRASELPRYLSATTLACAFLTFVRFRMPDISLSHVRPPYSVTLVSFVFATVGIVGLRYFWRFYCQSRQRDMELLERDERRFDNSTAARFLSGRTVMVTGAGGSIGSEIVRQVAAAGAAKILLVERSEHALYEIDREMRARADGKTAIVPLLTDIRETESVRRVFAAHRPSVVLHAAAYKHVPMVELNPDEGWRNNLEGTRTLATVALAYDVARFVLISTDKAVNPVSVMGRTKRAAEEAVMEANRERRTSFCAVRFGNVFGSSGSVVPLFREQIAKGGPVTVTHPDMRRYFMTVSEAVSLVLQAASRDERAVYTLDMGESVRVVDLAEGMIRQAGFRPYVDVPIVFTGIRPGEKLFEEIDISEKSAFRTDMAKIYITRMPEAENA